MPVNFNMDGPIPGENFTSDTRNYAWHRPPEYTNLDDAIEWISKMLMKKEGQFFVISMLQFGLTIKQIVSTLIMKGISQGKWSVDLGMLVAGPLSHMLVLIAKKEEIEFDLGIDSGVTLPTDNFFATVRKLRKPKDNNKEFKQEMKIAKEQAKLSGGFMGDEEPGPEDSMMDMGEDMNEGEVD